MIWGFKAIITIFALWHAQMIAPAYAGRLVADLSEKNVSITSSFHGTNLLLFGAMDGYQTDDVVIIIKGPPINIAHRRKAKVAGIWINVETNIWNNSPSLYQIFATKPLLRITDEETLTRLL